MASISDHTHFLLDISLVTTIPRPQKFRFENKWLDESDIENVVGRSWEGFKDFGILQRLKAMLEVLEDWRKHITKANTRNRRNLENEIHRLRRSNLGDGLIRLGEEKKGVGIFTD